MKIVFTDESSEKYYTILDIPNIDYPLMIENEEGEAMSITEKNIYDVLHSWFASEF